MEGKISFEQVLSEYKNDNGMSAHKMIKELTETASLDEKCDFAEYVLLVEAKYKESFLEDYALEYIVDGTDKGHQLSAELLIRYVMKEKLSNQILEKAYEQCQKLLENATEDCDKERYGNWKTMLEQQRKPVEVKEEPVQMEKQVIEAEIPAPVPQETKVMDKVPSILQLISSGLWVVAYVYFLIDVHSDIWATSIVLHWIPRIPDSGVLDIPIIGEYIGINALFALILGVIASALASTGKWRQMTKTANVMQVVSDIMCALIVVLHAYLQYLNGFSIFENIAEYIILFVIAIVLGSLLGAIGRKVLKWDE